MPISLKLQCAAIMFSLSGELFRVLFVLNILKQQQQQFSMVNALKNETLR
jgi:hypothetical protein